MLNRITIYMIDLISSNVSIVSFAKPMCIGTSASTAAASPLGIMNDIIDTSEIGVSFGVNIRHKIRRPRYISPVKIIPTKSIFPFPNWIDIPKNIKKNVFTRNMTSENKVFSMLVNSVK